MLERDLGNIVAKLSKFADAVKMCLIAMFKNYLNIESIMRVLQN